MLFVEIRPTRVDADREDPRAVFEGRAVCRCRRLVAAVGLAVPQGRRGGRGRIMVAAGIRNPSATIGLPCGCTGLGGPVFVLQGLPPQPKLGTVQRRIGENSLDASKLAFGSSSRAHRRRSRSAIGGSVFIIFRGKNSKYLGIQSEDARPDAIDAHVDGSRPADYRARFAATPRFRVRCVSAIATQLMR